MHSMLTPPLRVGALTAAHSALPSDRPTDALRVPLGMRRRRMYHACRHEASQLRDDCLTAFVLRGCGERTSRLRHRPTSHRIATRETAERRRACRAKRRETRTATVMGAHAKRTTSRTTTKNVDGHDVRHENEKGRTQT